MRDIGSEIDITLRNLKDEIDDLIDKIESLENDIGILEDTNANNIDENDALKAKIDDLYMKLDSKEDYIASLEEDLEKLQ